MSKGRHVKEILLLSLFLLASFGVGVISFISSNQQARNTTSAQAASNWDSLCRDGVYYVKNPNGSGEIPCGRAPNCDGRSYESMAGIDYRSNGKCWIGSGSCGPACKGQVPLCCYKMAESGNAEDCPFPERGYCMREQCKKQTQDSNCGAQQGAYCVSIDKCVEDRGDIPNLSLEDRLAGRTAPANAAPTNTPIPPTAVPPTSRPTQPITQNTQPPSQVNPTIADPTPTRQTGMTVITVEPTQRPQQPSPTSSDTYAFDFQDENESGNFGNNSQQQNPQETNQQQQTNNNYQQNPSNTEQSSNDDNSLAFNMPQIELKSPKQILRETVNQPTVEKLNQVTEKPLSVAKTSFITIKTYDKKLEDTVESWLFKIRVTLTRFIQ